MFSTPDPFWGCVLGLDYVSHEDILPYSSTDQVPIQHELFERFLVYDQTKGIVYGLFISYHIHASEWLNK